MRLVRTIFTLLVFFIVLLFLMQNYDVLKEPMGISFKVYGTPYIWNSVNPDGTGGVPYYFIIIGAFAVGGLFCGCFWMLDRFSLLKKNLRVIGALKKEVRQLKSQVGIAQQEKSNDVKQAKIEAKQTKKAIPAAKETTKQADATATKQEEQAVAG